MMKLSSIEHDWLPQPPDSWQVVPAWSLFDEGTEGFHLSDPHLIPSRIHGVVTQEQYSELTGLRTMSNDVAALVMKHVDSGDFVISMGSHETGIEYSPVVGKVSNDYRVLKPTEYVVPAYFRWFFKSRPLIEGLAGLTNEIRVGQRIHYSKFATLWLPLPSAEVQHRIADYLDRETGEIDAMIAKMDELRETLDVRRQQSIDEAFTGLAGLAPLWSLTDGIIDCPHTTPEPDENGSAEAVRTASVRAGKYIPENGITVSADTAAQRNGAFPPRPGDIFFTREAPAGEATIVPEGNKFCLGQRMVLIRIDPDVTDSRFLLYALYTGRVQEEFRLSAGGSTVVNLKLGTIRATLVPCGSLPEQKRLADYLDDVTSKIDQMLAKVAELKSLLTERRAALITDVVTGRKEVA